MTKLLAIAASNRADSLNKKLLAIAVAVAEHAGASVQVLDYEMLQAPLYRDEANAAMPQGVQLLRAALATHDGLLLASPEYNWSMPAHVKNLIDWLSLEKPSALARKNILLMCASPSVRGGILGLHQLALPLNHLGAYVYPHLIAIGGADAQLGAHGIGNAKDAAFLAECVQDFVRVTQLQAGR